MTIIHPVPVYPRHGDLPTPTKGPRVKIEGEPNYTRNKGTIKERVFDDTKPIVKTPKPNPRCPTSDSRNNYKIGWYGTVPPLLNGTSSPRPNTAPPRIKPEGEATAYISRGPRMKVIVHSYAKSGASPRYPRVKTEGQEIAEKSKGGRIKKIVHNFGILPPSTCVVPRLNLYVEPRVENNQGKRMKDNIHNYGHNKTTPKPQPRVTREGEDNAELDKGKRMEMLFTRYGRRPLSARSVPRVKKEGEPNAYLDTGFRMCRLMHEPKSIPCTPRPLPRTNSSQARNNSFKARGSMDAIFKNLAHRTFIFPPGQQSKQYVRASIA